MAWRPFRAHPEKMRRPAVSPARARPGPGDATRRKLLLLATPSGEPTRHGARHGSRFVRGTARTVKEAASKAEEADLEDEEECYDDEQGGWAYEESFGAMDSEGEAMEEAQRG